MRAHKFKKTAKTNFFGATAQTRKSADSARPDGDTPRATVEIKGDSP